MSAGTTGQVCWHGVYVFVAFRVQSRQHARVPVCAFRPLVRFCFRETFCVPALMQVVRVCLPPSPTMQGAQEDLFPCCALCVAGTFSGMVRAGQLHVGRVQHAECMWRGRVVQP